MTGIDERLGGRLPLVDPETLTAEQRALYEHLEKHQFPAAAQAGYRTTTAGGRVIGPFNAVVLEPGVGGGLVAFMEAEVGSTSLDNRVRQTIILAVGAVWGAAYELYAHSAEARAAGLPAAVIAALTAGEIPDELSEAEQAAARVGRQLAGDRRIDDDVYVSAQRVFGDRGMVDIILLVGYYQTVCGVLNAFEIPVPDPAH